MTSPNEQLSIIIKTQLHLVITYINFELEYSEENDIIYAYNSHSVSFSSIRQIKMRIWIITYNTTVGIQMHLSCLENSSLSKTERRRSSRNREGHYSCVANRK